METPGSKMLNVHVHSKRVWTRGEDGEDAFEVLGLLMFLAFNLIKAFRESLDADEIRGWVGRMVIPLAGVVSILMGRMPVGECLSGTQLVEDGGFDGLTDGSRDGRALESPAQGSAPRQGTLRPSAPVVPTNAREALTPSARGRAGAGPHAGISGGRLEA